MLPQLLQIIDQEGIAIHYSTGTTSSEISTVSSSNQVLVRASLLDSVTGPMNESQFSKIRDKAATLSGTEHGSHSTVVTVSSLLLGEDRSGFDGEFKMV